MQFVKWILIGLLAIIIAIVGYVAFVLDLNSYKPVISEKVKEATGRELTIAGDIGLSFYPTLGMELQQVSLSNIPGEQLPPLLQIDLASVGVAVMPILQGELQVEALVVNGADLTMVTLADGRTSTTGLGESTSSNEDSGTSSTTQSKANQDWSLGLFQLNDLRLVNDNRAAGTVQTVTISQLQLNDLAPNRSAPLKLILSIDDGTTQINTEADSMLAFAKDFSRIQIDGWQQKVTVAGEAVGEQPLQLTLGMQADIDLTAQKVSLPAFSFGLGEFLFEGQGSAAYGGKVPQLNLTGKGNRLDVTPFIGGDTTAANEDNQSETPPSSEPAPEPDLSVLSSINANIKLALEQLVAANIRVDDINTTVVLKDGVLSLDKLTGTSFQGAFSVSAKLDGTAVPATYEFSKQLKGLAIQPLLQALAESDLLEGSGNLTLVGKGKGLAGGALINNLTANGELSLNDGAVNGVNLAQMIRNAKATFSGDKSAVEDEVKKTDFSSFDVSIRIADGKLTLPDLALASPLLRVSGDGEVGITDQSVQMALVVALVGSIEGQGGGDTDTLKDIPIPLKIGGSVSEPTFGIDMSGLKDEVIEQETDKIKKKLEDKLKDKLFGSFSG
ncbi:AsmA family protein [Ferrimonas lipolytica]|uniref:AsmA family protein n=1 Tax=Ferrimonas lipolytica TaxID=2724191 RepID=A0A6H1UDY6_9GAMM|nr:AsmA family protein [Ferrimonas lipolytica]QIZ76839.1 AsmA family protein [Ferrimonas lipolytica]